MASRNELTRVYLDFNAATPIDVRVLEEYIRTLEQSWANSSSIHQEGQRAKSILAEARSRIAACFSVRPQQVVFFSTATEALNTLLRGLLVKHLHASIISSPVEHAAVYETCKRLEQEGGQITLIPVGSYGAVRPELLQETITPSTTGIALMSVNNETGVMTDIQRIASIAAERQIPLLVDGVAQLGKAPFTLFPGLSAAVFCSPKIYAPVGVGFAILNTGVTFQPLVVGGGQEFGLRSGSENVAAIHATSIAVELLLHDIETEVSNMTALRNYFEGRLMESLSGVLINGEGPRVSNTSNLAFDGVSGEDLLIQLDLAGVAASHGAACAAGALEPSRILLQMGYSTERARSSLRFSLGKGSSKEDIDFAVAAIVRAVQKQRSYEPFAKGSYT